ncbi:L-threonylcarbamoyladenylate synthase [Pseudomonadota bacterium]
MEIIKAKSGDAIRKAHSVLKDGGVVMHATETCYGLAADIFNESALRKVYSLKKMDESKPISIMVQDLSEAERYAEFNEGALRLAKRFWPGPLTIILPERDTLPTFFNRSHSFVGIRNPDSSVSKEILDIFDGPLTTTSANISGEAECYSVEDYLVQIEGADSSPDLIIDSGEIVREKPSTIVQAEGERFIFVREGSLFKEVKIFLGM